MRSVTGPLLYVVPDARFFVTHRLPLALAARARGWDVHVATPDGAAVEAIRAAGLPWHRVRFGALRRKPWSDAQTLFDLLRLYRRLKPALVHHVTFKAVLYGTLAARVNRVPAVVNAMTGLGDVFAARSAGDRAWRAITIALFRAFVRHRRMRVIVQNADDLRELAAARAVRESDVVLIRGSGVDPSAFTPAARGPNEVPVVLFAGRIVRAKGIEELVAAARLLRGEGVRARFVVAGDRDRDSGVTIPDAAFAAWLGDIEYAGMVDDVRPLYAAADLVCLPSWREGLPKSLLEAAACALPIVTTDVPGCRDVVRDGENGFVVPPRDARALAGALRALLDDAELRARLGRRGREIVIAEFSLERVVGETLDVYAALATAGADCA